MFNISDEEKKALLDQHKQPYNGYQTLQVQQPDNIISVYDPAGDKKGVQVTANGGVRTYSNFNLRESKSNMCECGGMMYEGECMECGKSYMDEGIYDEEDLDDDTEFDYVQEEDDVEFMDDDTESEKEEENKDFCKYQKRMFGPQDERYREKCLGRSAVKDLAGMEMNMNETLKGNQRKIDKNNITIMYNII